MYDCIRDERKQVWGGLRSKECDDSFTAKARRNIYPQTCRTKLRTNTTMESLYSSRRSFVILNCCGYVLKQIVVTTLAPNSAKSATKD